MAQMHCRSNEEVFDETSDDFKILMIPKNASEEGKSGITIKGSNNQYEKAHKVLMDLFRKKGERFVINSNEICITDVPSNKPVNVDIKCPNSLSGKANLRIYAKNAKGISTIMISKPSGGDMIHVKNLAFKVIKYLLDGVISDEIGQKEIDQMRRKTGVIKLCERCDETFATKQLLSEHLSKSHEAEKEFTCDLCDSKYSSKTEMTQHKEEEHMDTSSPVLKKIKLNLDENVSNVGKVKALTENEDEQDFDSLNGEPGYIGFKCLSKENTEVKDDQFMQKVLEVRNEFEVMRNEFKQLKFELETQNKKQIDSLKLEIKKLKESYSQCMDDLKNETYARLKAEESCKVLQDTIEAKIKIQAQASDTGDVSLGEVMEIDIQKEVEASNQLLGEANIEDKNKSELKHFVCDECVDNFTSIEDLLNHKQSCHRKYVKCVNCDDIFETEESLKVHADTQHRRNQVENLQESFECQICKETFNDKESCENHKSKHSHIKCIKCDKSYEDMASLRRHDWRCHRSVNCNICDETLNSRQEIASHREQKHKLFKKEVCRYFPRCLDGDECLYLHDNSACVNGENCQDQSCEKQHRKVLMLSCKFQENCNKVDCQFRHLVPRKAFLEEDKRIRQNARI